MYKTICAPQVKAARALLGWSQEDLAQATQLSITTIRTMELGNVPRASTIEHIRKTIERNGLEFTDGDGIKRRDNEVITLRGSDSCDRLFEDINNTISKQGGNVIAVIKSHEVLMQADYAGQRTNMDRLAELQGIADVKCLIADAIKPSIVSLSVEARTISQHLLDPMSCFVYGNKYAHILPEGRMQFMIVVFSIASVALNYHKHYLSLWDNAVPLRMQRFAQKHTA